MVSVILSFIVLVIKCSAVRLSTIDNNPNIHIAGLSSREIETASHYTAILNKPLHIYFENITVSNAWCYDYYDHAANIDNYDLPQVKDSSIHFKAASEKMSTLWKCVTQENKLTTYILYFYLHVKGAKTIEMEVNGRQLSFNPGNLLVPYDGSIIYHYKEGDKANVVCRNLHGTGTVHLEYITEDFSSEKSSGLVSATYGFTLRLKNNNSYIDCVYETTKPTDKYIYRITFITNTLYANETETLLDVKADANITGQYVNENLPISLVLGSCTIAVVLFLNIIGILYCYIRRNFKYIETPYGDLNNLHDTPTPQETNECDNRFVTYYDNNRVSNRGYDVPEHDEYCIDQSNNYYTEIDYFKCKPKLGEVQRNTQVYDEPYVHIDY